MTSPRPGAAPPSRQIAVRGALAFLDGGTWTLHTRHVVVSVIGDDGKGRRALDAIAGLNPPIAGVAAGARSRHPTRARSWVGCPASAPMTSSARARSSSIGSSVRAGACG